MIDPSSGWQEKAIDIQKQDSICEDIQQRHREIFLTQENRPQAMTYFDQAVLNAFGSRIDELIELKKKGAKIVGLYCTFVPEEIIVAAGAIPIGLSMATELSIADAEIVLPREICPMIKSFAGLIFAKSFGYAGIVDLLVGETTCDAKKKTWEILNHYIPVHFMELPQKKILASRELWAREIFALKERLELECDKRITAQDLTAATHMVNAKRRALERLSRLRRKSPLPISGKDASLVYQVALMDDIQRFTQQVETLCDELEERIKNKTGVAPANAPRLMILGCPMVMPDWKLHDIIETCGAVIVGDDTCVGARYHLDPAVDWNVDTLTMQIKLIAERYINIPCPCFTPGYCGILSATQMTKDHRVDGVIYYVLQFCHGFNIEYNKYERFLNQTEIPVFKIQTDYSYEDTGQIKTRIEAFLETISN